MNYIRLGIRLSLGLVFFVFGLNKFLHFAVIPPFDGVAATYVAALHKTGYFFPLLGSTELVSGALLLLGIYVPLALILLAPVIVNIFLFHVFLAPLGSPVAVALVLMELYLAWMNRAKFRSILEIR